MPNRLRAAQRLTRASRLSLGALRCRGEAANLVAATILTSSVLGGVALVVLAAGVANVMTANAAVGRATALRELAHASLGTTASLPRTF